MNDDNPVSGTDIGLLVEGNLLACGAGMSEQSRRDVKNAFHFATLVADKALNVEERGRAWYNKFLDVMRDVGFTTPRRSFEKQAASELQLTLGAVAVRTIGAAGSALVGGTKLGVLAKGAFDKLSTVEHDSRIVHHKRKRLERGSVSVAACVETEQGEVVMIMTCLESTEPNLSEDVLGVQFKLERSAYYSGQAVLALNHFVYDQVRATLENKLGVRSIENVLQYDI